MTRAEAINYLTSTGLTEEQVMKVVEALEQEPCEDAISRQVVLSMQYRIDDSATLSTRDVVNVDDIEDLPPVNPQPKTGHWKKMVEVYDLQQNRMLVPYGYDDAKFGNTPVYVCDCGCESTKNSRFCPNCGAKMVEPQESEDKA